MTAFYFFYILYGATQGLLVLQLANGLLEPKRMGRQYRIGQAAVILLIAALCPGNLTKNEIGFPSVLLPDILVSTVGTLILYRCGILNAVCLNIMGWTGITLTELFPRTFLTLLLRTIGKQDLNLLTVCLANSWYPILWSIAAILAGLAWNKSFSGKKQTLAEYQQILPPLTILAVVVLLCLRLLPEPLLIQWVIFLFCCLLLFIALLAGIWKHDTNIENRMLQMKMSLLEDKYQTLLENNSEHAILVHDIRNHLRTVSTMLEQKKPEEAAQYLFQLNGEIETGASVTWSNHEMLDLILNMKFREARKAQIAVDCHCDDMKALTLKPAQVCALFSNLLDNAIEANMKCPPGTKRWIVLKCTRREKMLVVSLSNPVTKPVSASAGDRKSVV